MLYIMLLYSPFYVIKTVLRSIIKYKITFDCNKTPHIVPVIGSKPKERSGQKRVLTSSHTLTHGTWTECSRRRGHSFPFRMSRHTCRSADECVPAVRPCRVLVLWLRLFIARRKVSRVDQLGCCPHLTVLWPPRIGRARHGRCRRQTVPLQCHGGHVAGSVRLP